MSKRMTIQKLQKLQQTGKINSFQMKGKQPTELSPKRSKYGNVRIQVDGMWFDSKKEGRRYQDLALLLKADKIGVLEMQVSYDLVVEGKMVARYVADFRYRDVQTGALVVEDVKSKATRKNRIYRLKKKLMKAIYNIEIKEM